MPCRSDNASRAGFGPSSLSCRARDLTFGGSSVLPGSFPCGCGDLKLLFRDAERKYLDDYVLVRAFGGEKSQNIGVRGPCRCRSTAVPAAADLTGSALSVLQVGGPLGKPGPAIRVPLYAGRGESLATRHNAM